MAAAHQIRILLRAQHMTDGGNEHQIVALAQRVRTQVAVAERHAPRHSGLLDVPLRNGGHGGAVDARLSDAYLVTSIIYPSYDLAPYPKNDITSGGESRMPHYADHMTVQQLADIVAFLQSRYYVPRLPDNYR